VVCLSGQPADDGFSIGGLFHLNQLPSFPHFSRAAGHWSAGFQPAGACFKITPLVLKTDPHAGKMPALQRL